jgi:small glutamine-rich tetratricopeptide repeat-containing protein alpha
MDAADATRLDPSYAKGWSRLGAAQAAQGKHGDAVLAYEQALKLDPGNAAAKEGLAAAKKAAGSSGSVGAAKASGAGAGAGGFGGMAGLASMMGGMGGMGGGGGGMPDMGAMAGLMSDPDVAAALTDPSMAAVLADLQAKGPAGLMAHMGNPKVMALAGKLMAKMGGMGGK